jgi:hypothetical protein
LTAFHHRETPPRHCLESEMIMTRFISLSLFGCLTVLAIGGCTEKTTVTSEKTIKTPAGTVDVKTTQEVKKTGDQKDK